MRRGRELHAELGLVLTALAKVPLLGFWLGPRVEEELRHPRLGR